MGLGKTVVTIAAVERLIESGAAFGGFVIVPSSLKYQWARQIDAFTGGTANVLVVDGDLKKRTRQYVEVMAGRVEYAIMNYEQIVNDWAIVRRLPRDFIALDEATAIKNPTAARSKRIKALKAHRRWALTGQAVENRAEEVYSIMEWVDPAILGPPLVFDATFITRDGYGNVIRYRNLPLLHTQLKKVMVRKTWNDPDVRDQMPKFSEESFIVAFDPATAKLYRLMVRELLDLLAGMTPNDLFDVGQHYGGDSQVAMGEVGAVMSILGCLRMLCDHSDLLRRSAEIYDGTVATAGSRVGSAYAADLAARGLIPAPGKGKGPKLDATIGLLEEILAADPVNKVVLFSFFKDSLALIAARSAHLCGHAIFTGDISAKDRDREKQRFLDDPACRLFLSSDAGGYGVDLPNANYLISYDLPQSAGAWKQRNARIIRLSSKFKHLTIISMLMAGSIEERQYDSLTQKQAAANAILDGVGADAKGQLDFDLATLTSFLETSELTITG